MKHILDRDFKYTPALKTDVRATIERVRKEQQALAAQPQKVTTIKPRVRGKA